MTTRNELKGFEEEFFKNIRNKAAWKNISKSDKIPWSEKLIEKYADKLDWTELCENDNIPWNAEMIEKFKKRIDWEALSKCILWRNENKCFFDWNILKKFENYWNWYELSKYSSFIPTFVIEEYADNWIWKELIDNRHIPWSYEMFEKFKKYIPIADFDTLQRSALWLRLVELDEHILLGQILAE
jgi:hypothetical protein